MKRVRILAVVVILVLLLPVLACGGDSSEPPPYKVTDFTIGELLPPYEVTNFTVEAIYARSILFTTSSEGTIKGFFLVSGGEKDIYFRILDPYGYIVFGPRFVTDMGEFKIKCAYAGEYTLEFDNGLSLYDRQITLYYRGYSD